MNKTIIESIESLKSIELKEVKEINDSEESEVVSTTIKGVTYIPRLCNRDDHVESVDQYTIMSFKELIALYQLDLEDENFILQAYQQESVMNLKSFILPLLYAKNLKLNWKFLLTLNKTYWMELYKTDWVMNKIEIKTTGIPYIHRFILFQVNNDFLGVSELKADSSKKMINLKQTIIKVNGSFKENTKYINPRMILPAEGVFSNKSVDCKISWIEFMLRHCLHEMLYKEYNVLNYNCHVWCNKLLENFNISKHNILNMFKSIRSCKSEYRLSFDLE